jgi:hypothetical protein
MNSADSEKNADYIEAIVVMSPAGARELVEKWFVERTFKCVPMRAGFLVVGDRAAVDRTFGVKIAGLSEHVDLPIPKELVGQVISITIPKPPVYGQDTSKG